MQEIYKNLSNDLIEVLKENKNLVVDGNLVKNKITELALNIDNDLLKLLLKKDSIKKHFFTKVNDVLVFDKVKFQNFVNNKEFLKDSYTAFKNKIGLTVNDEYLSDNKEVVLSWAYKDCILEGGQTKEDEKRDEIFWNEILAPDEIDRLLEPKVFTNFKKFDVNGEHKVTELSKKDNFIIKGNNLIALHSLKNIYAEQIKLIYIDPPYNTGSDSFSYNDSFNHSTWLTFMKNRLSIAKELLRDDGAIFVQIDYKEVAYLTILMDEIFGRENFVQLISVRTSSPAGFKTVNPGPIDVTEYILFYTKKRNKFKFKKTYVPVSYDDNYKYVIVNKNEKPTNWILEPLRNIVYKENGIKIENTDPKTNKNAEAKWGNHWKIIREQLMSSYALENSDNVVSIRDPHKPTDKLKQILKKSSEERDKIFLYEKNKEENIENGSSSNYGYIINGGSLSFYSNKVKEIDGEKTPTELLTDFWRDISWDGIAKEGGVKLKNGKKPEKLIKRIFEIGTDDKNDIILDFNLGSGTTCAVAHKLGLRYIGIEQLDYNENDSIIRLNNVINGDNSGISKIVNWAGGGSFICFEVAEANEKFVYEIKSANSTKKLLSIWDKMKSTSFLSYKVDINKFDNNVSDFNTLSLDNQKKFLIEILDKNMLYIPYLEINDKDFDITKEDKVLNEKLYNMK